MNGLSDIGVEKRLMAGLLKYPELYTNIKRKLTEKMFSSDKVCLIYHLVCQFYDANPLVTLNTGVVIQLIKNNKPKNERLVFEIVKQIYQHFNQIDKAETLILADKIKYLYRWRILIQACANVTHEATNGADLDKAINTISQAHSEILLETASITSGEWATDLNQRIDDIIQRKKNPRINRGVPIPIKELDEFIGGLKKQELMAVTLKPGHGKTAYLCNAALNAALRGYNVLFFTIESSKSHIQYRIDSAFTQINHEQFRLATIDSDGIKKWASEISLRKSQLGRIEIIDIPDNVTPAIIQSLIREYEPKFKIDLVLIDYMNIMSTNMSIGGMYDWKLQTLISLELKRVARLCDIPILTAIQQSEDGDAAFARYIKQNLDYLLTTTAPNNVLGQMGYEELSFLKGREVDATKRFWIHKDFSTMRFDTGKRPTAMEIESAKQEQTVEEDS